MEAVLSFVKEYWYWILAAIVVVFLALKLIKAILKWILIVALAGGLVYWGVHYRAGERPGGGTDAAAVAAVKDGALDALRRELHDAEFERHRDGSFTVRTKSVELVAKPGAKKAQVRFMGRTFTVDLDRNWNALLEDVQKRL